MPPTKPRVLTQEEPTSAPREKPILIQPATSRLKRNGNIAMTNGTPLKEVIYGAHDTHAMFNGNGIQSNHHSGVSGLTWSSEELETLHAYRTSYRLDAPSAFKNPLGHVILKTGIGQYSPTMARRKDKRRVAKDQLALSVRKNFNALAVNETEVIVDLLYKVKTQDKSFRARFAPPRK